jgi:hypothetical protein
LAENPPGAKGKNLNNPPLAMNGQRMVEKPYVCSLCQNSFKRKEHLLRHELSRQLCAGWWNWLIFSYQEKTIRL